jgi:PAS domain S-box-containing protein
MAVVAQGFSGDEDLDKKMMVRLLDQARNNDYIAGGGVWPEPFVYDKTKERASFFWGKTNNTFVFYDDYNSPEGMGYRHENWYVPSKYTARDFAFWSQSYIDVYSKVPMVTVSVPIYKDNTFHGVVTVDVSLEGLNTLFVKETKAFDGYAFLIDRDGKVLSNPNGKYKNMEELTKAFPQYTALKKRLDEHLKEDLFDTENTKLHQDIQKEINGITKEESGRIASIINGLQHRSSQYEEFILDDEIIGGKAHASLIEIKDLHWKLIIVMPKEYIYRQVSDIYNLALISMLLIMGVLYILSLLTFKKIIAKPIKKISDELILIMDKNHPKKYLSEDGNDEFTYLAEQFNKQSSRLHHAQEKLLNMNALVMKEVELKTKSLEEEKATFETLFNDTTDGMILLKNSHFVKCNDAAVKLFKHRSKTSLLGVHPISFSPKFQPDGSLSAVKAREIQRKVMEKGSYIFEWTYLQTDGNIIPCQVTLTKIFLEGESIIHAIIKDITKQVRLQKQMEYKNNEY